MCLENLSEFVRLALKVSTDLCPNQSALGPQIPRQQTYSGMLLFFGCSCVYKYFIDAHELCSINRDKQPIETFPWPRE